MSFVKMRIVIVAFAATAMMFVAGCLNLYTRFPTTNPEIEDCYQCTRVMVAMTIVGSFPQMMSDCPSNRGLMWENAISIPFLGFPMAIDTACEAVVDTICLPYDWHVHMLRSDKHKPLESRDLQF